MKINDFVGKTAYVTGGSSGIGLASDDAATDGFGLSQVRERLASAYGELASFELHSEQAPGTLVRITYPCSA